MTTQNPGEELGIDQRSKLLGTTLYPCWILREGADENCKGVWARFGLDGGPIIMYGLCMTWKAMLRAQLEARLSSLGWIP